MENPVNEAGGLLSVAIVTVVPRSPGGLKVLSPSPFVLKSYVMWRARKDGFTAPDIDTFVFDLGITTGEMIANLGTKHYDVVACSVYIWNCNDIIEFADNYKRQNPEVVIVFGGPQVSPVADEIIVDYPFVDIIPYVTAPGETIFYYLLRALAKRQPLSEVSNILYRSQNGTINKTGKNIEKIDISQLPSPFLDGTVHIEADQNYMAIIESSRGCPFGCAYCFWGSGDKGVEYFTDDRIIAEIAMIYSHPSVKHVFFTDSDFLLKVNRANQFIDTIMHYGGERVKTEVEIDARGINETKKDAVLKLMRLSNGYILFAVQTTTPEALKLIGKRAGPEVFRNRASLLRSWLPDVKIVVDVMLPLPGDTLSGYLETLDFVLNLEPVRMILNPVILLPGTAYYEQRDSMGLRYSGKPTNILIETPTFPKTDVETALQISIWFEVLTYYHPATAAFFYATCSRDGRRRIDRLRQWIDAIEGQLRLFSPYHDLVDRVTSSIKELNAVKGSVMRHAVSPRESTIIFETILALEGERYADLTGDLIVGKEIFRSLAASSEQPVDPYVSLRGETNAFKTDVSRIIPRFSFY
ncbi:B12-binding domain-containing radical SAM protein [Candidatus Magnetomonas plexicatena]|uniref:B12-binding domain-containing radical SAM protein n=1 Tax=Candidatus Magnetomonas plexicatena TaxID=2552947 RepID=UPI001C78CE63|nr:radical SAM protein [Nitrospirales bacterium LBB_01]